MYKYMYIMYITIEMLYIVLIMYLLILDINKNFSKNI